MIPLDGIARAFLSALCVVLVLGFAFQAGRAAESRYIIDVAQETETVHYLRDVVAQQLESSAALNRRMLMLVHGRDTLLVRVLSELEAPAFSTDTPDTLTVVEVD